MLRSALLILSSNAMGSALLLARSLIVARLVTVADFGIASTLALAMAVVEMVSAFGVGLQIVQSKEGDDPRFQAALQGFQLIRSLINGAILFALAGPLAAFLNVPEATWGYQVMALVPVLGALSHMDAGRLNRQMIFGPSILIAVVPATASLLSIWPLWELFGDWRVMLFAILIQSGVGTILSHLVARRPYQLAFDRKQIASTMRFGWPILSNNVLIFLVFHGDKLIVGRMLGMETLAIFAMGVTLTLTPTLIISKSFSNLTLPPLARQPRGTPDEERRFQRMASSVMEVYFAAAMLIVVGTCLLGPLFVQMVLGDRYAALGPLLVWMAILQTLRMIKGGPGTIALARGITTNPLISNLVRAALLPAAWLALHLGWGVLTVLALAILGELIGLGVSLLLIRGRSGVPLRPILRMVMVVALFYLAAIGYGLADVAAPRLDLGAHILRQVTMALMVGTGLVATASATQLTRQLRGWQRGR